MKKILLILFVAVTALTACKKDKDSTGKLEGRWDATKEYYITTVKGTGTKISEGNNTFEENEIYFDFKGNNYSTYGDGKLEDNGTFTENNGSITFNGKSDSNTAIIKWNSSTEFVLSVEDNETNDDGTVYIHKSDFTFKKH